MPKSKDDGQQTVAGLAAETLTGDIATFLTDRIKHLPKVWAQMTENEQREVIDSAIMAAGHLVREAVTIIAADGRTTLQANLEKIEVKDGLKAVLALSRHDEHRHEMIDSVGKAVLIVVADAAQYSGGEVPKPDPDQRELPTQEAAE